MGLPRKVFIIHQSTKEEIITAFKNHLKTFNSADGKSLFSVMEYLLPDLSDDQYISSLRTSLDECDIIIILVDQAFLSLSPGRREVIRNCVSYTHKPKYIIRLDEAQSRLPRFKERIVFNRSLAPSNDGSAINDGHAIDIVSEIAKDLNKLGNINEVTKHSLLLFLYFLVFAALAQIIGAMWHDLDDYVYVGLLASLLSSTIGGFGFWHKSDNFVERIILAAALSLAVGIPWSLYAAILEFSNFPPAKKLALSLFIYVAFCVTVIVSGRLMTWFRKSEPILVDTIFGITVSQKHHGIRVCDLFWIIFLFPIMLDLLTHGVFQFRTMFYVFMIIVLWRLMRHLGIYDHMFYDHPIDTNQKFTAGPREFGAFLIVGVYISQLLFMLTKLLPFSGWVLRGLQGS